MYRKDPENPDFFRIAGEMRGHLRAIDWNATLLGPPQGWPESLKTYLSMIWELPSPAVIFWGDDYIQFYNQGYADIMGPQRHPRYLGARAQDCWPDVYPMLRPQMERVVKDGVSKTFESMLLILTRYGFEEEAYFTFTFSPLRNDSGEIKGLYQPVVDVTESVLGERRSATLRALARRGGEHRPVEDALMVFSENKLDIPFSLIYLWDETNQRLELAGQSGFGKETYSAEQLEGFSKEAAKVCKSLAPRVLDDIVLLFPSPHINVWKDVTRSAYMAPLRHSARGDCAGIIIFGLSSRLGFDAKYRDFLEECAGALMANLEADRAQKVEAKLIKRERAARREAEFQRADLVRLLAQAPAPIVILRGADLVVELVNDYTCRVWGREPDEVLGRPILDALPEVRGTIYDTMLHEVFDSGETQVGRELEYEGVDPSGQGGTTYLDFVYSPLHRPDGEVDGLLIIAFDVTEQVRARNETDRLRHAAEAANRAKDEFLAMLGHELRNPLAPIITAVELMELKGGEQFRKERDIIVRQAEHMVTLIDDLLDISRITRGKVELRRRRVDVAEVLARAVEMTAPLFASFKHETVIDVVDEPLWVLADPARLAQVLSNLLTNAAKYTPTAGKILVRAERDGDEVLVSVKDTGIGIDAEVLPRIFETFMQEGQSLDRARGGLGLGLAIVHNLVALHGGSVQARSPGRDLGSEFIVRLPALEVSKEDTKSETFMSPPAHPVRRDSGGYRILVVDDNEDAADALGSWLEIQGYQVQVAHNAEEALACVDAHSPDLSLMDIGLPRTDGYELARRLRARSELSELPIIAVTGYGQVADRKRSKEAGFYAHLTKPVSLEQLSPLIDSLLTADG